ncbi:acetyl/propionyl/methylcrotonyl-CoA carboxylase subunit alpha [Frigidibacter sp. MR17.14]|uniref:acetyl/propionyl/methylcrotonyl-CoA carboxylase subunit alpha n=1 Tax=Frigidibacter sp. MR17.14 TaxID=3126509 RepID=UPI003012AD83
MFRRILIANRGEIACRVIATCRQMGIETVAVHSDADAGAKHVALADMAVRIGPPAVADSYLRGDRIIAAALETGAEAIHPGYGFLSENPDFVEAVEAAGLVFIGPPASAIRAMGLKDAAKALMETAGVPVVPGYHGADQDPAHLQAEADRIGYPVLIKARAGGGGKGMRLVDRAQDFAESLASAQREGQASFGDPAVLVEKYVTAPRHVEIQVFADAHGNVIHLFERDCSLQRRHQKVIEEAPAPGMTPEVRAAMGQAAVEAARAIGYRGAGTVEFIADGSRGLSADGFWFMEMNTRLQVEHPVSEAITGLDFVELQLRVAAGEPLPVAQGDLRIDGHAFEARLYAEDVPKGFLPATGRLARLDFPQGAEFARGPVRIDAGVRAGDQVSPWYDPMIAKIIAHGPDRATALARLEKALAATQVAGVVTNLGFLGALTRHPGFAAGEVDTGLIGRDLATLTATEPPPPEACLAAALALAGLSAPPERNDPWSAARLYRHWGPAEIALTLVHAETEHPVTLSLEDDRVTMAGETWRFAATPGTITLRRGELTRPFRVTSPHLTGPNIPAGGIPTPPQAVTIASGAASWHWTRLDPLDRAEASGAGGNEIRAPMPGLVTRLMAAEGQEVAEGEALLVLEAMKMEHLLRAPRAGRIESLGVALGAQVQDGDLLVRMDDADG